MNYIDQVWARLVNAARQAETVGSTEIPPGFATRVIANRKIDINSASVWEFLSIRALVFAFFLMVGSIVINYNIINDNWISNLAMNYSSVNDDWANSSAIADIIPELISTP
ncbi:MAG: hypothetical protein C4291_02185 [Candidatus Dadabacteria bacterium]